jgi:hypothetical protein
VADTLTILHPTELSSFPLPVSPPTSNRPAQHSQKNYRKSKLQPNRSAKIDHEKLNPITPRIGKQLGGALNQVQHRLLPGGKKLGRVPKA